jgi:hypothetical protein
MKSFIFSLIILVALDVHCQEDAWVYFNAKPNAQAFFDNPLSELSQRSLDRRATQNIALDFKDVPIYQPYVDQVTSAAGITIMAKSKWLNCLHVRGEVADINALSSLSFVDHIHFADATLNLRATQTAQRPIHKTMETATTFNYGNSFNQIHMLNGDILHAQNYTGTGKIIAVLDAGFPGVDVLAPFQRLRDNGQILGGYDYVNKSSDFYTSNSHGMMVLSTMGGFVDSQLVGTAPDAQYYLFITEDVNSENPVEESNWVEAAEEADRLGVDVITSSLGYFAFDNPNYGHTYADMTGDAAFASQGANIAFTKGMVVVASAGNEGNSTEPHVGVPAEANNVLAIGAVRSNRLIASFSSVGPSFDGRIKPDLMAQGQSSVLSTTTGTVGTASGTSFSGPILAGMIATFWSALPNLTNQQVVDYVKQSADKFATPDNQYGYGIPDFSAALNTALATHNFDKNKFIVTPNPTKDFVSISFPSRFEKATISVYSSFGQLVLSLEVSNQSAVLSLNSMKEGTYLYKIQTDSYSQTGKIVKQ